MPPCHVACEHTQGSKHCPHKCHEDGHEPDGIVLPGGVLPRGRQKVPCSQTGHNDPNHEEERTDVDSIGRGSGRGPKTQSRKDPTVVQANGQGPQIGVQHGYPDQENDEEDHNQVIDPTNKLLDPVPFLRFRLPLSGPLRLSALPRVIGFPVTVHFFTFLPKDQGKAGPIPASFLYSTCLKNVKFLVLTFFYKCV